MFLGNVEEFGGSYLGGHHCCWILMGVLSSRKQKYENNKLWILIRNISQQQWSIFYVFLFFLVSDSETLRTQNFIPSRKGPFPSRC